MNKYNERELAEWLHNNYEEITKERGWATQKTTQVAFKDLPKENKEVMIEIARRIIRRFVKNGN